jgi:transcriptional regulator with XRE-family HTH domain
MGGRKLGGPVDANPLTVAGRLLKARLAKRWTRVRLYAESGVHPNTISDIENARNQHPSFEKVVRLARALEMTPEDLCPVSDIPEEPQLRRAS